jgi:Rrf2 family protein
MWRSSEYLCTQESSTPGTHSMPASVAAAIAAGTPATPSWSVSAIVVTPAAAAERATSAGSSSPSETVECDWRSIRAIGGRHFSDRAAFLTEIVKNADMRITAKADYAVRATLELAASPNGEPVKGEKLADAQKIPLQFLEHILLDLKHSELVKAKRGIRGGYWLARDPAEITVADVIRAVEGPLANIHDRLPEDTEYSGNAAHLRDVWVAVRANLRGVLENVTLADVRDGTLPPAITKLLGDEGAWAVR